MKVEDFSHEKGSIILNDYTHKKFSLSICPSSPEDTIVCISLSRSQSLSFSPDIVPVSFPIALDVYFAVAVVSCLLLVTVGHGCMSD